MQGDTKECECRRGVQGCTAGFRVLGWGAALLPETGRFQEQVASLKSHFRNLVSVISLHLLFV